MAWIVRLGLKKSKFAHKVTFLLMTLDMINLQLHDRHMSEPPSNPLVSDFSDAASALNNPLAGKSVLIVEDDPFIALALEETLGDFGVIIAGQAHTIARAERLAREANYDLALLDVNVGHETIDTVADIVAARAIPFVFTTGHGRAGLPEAHRDRSIVEKPFYVDELLRTLKEEVLKYAPSST